MLVEYLQLWVSDYAKIGVLVASSPVLRTGSSVAFSLRLPVAASTAQENHRELVVRLLVDQTFRSNQRQNAVSDPEPGRDIYVEIGIGSTGTVADCRKIGLLECLKPVTKKCFLHLLKLCLMERQQ